MRLSIYTIFDSATGAYIRPFYFQSDGQATRQFKDLALDKDHEIGRHPEDYSLHWLGFFDDQNAEIEATAPKHLCTALELIAQERSARQEDMLEANGAAPVAVSSDATFGRGT